MTVGRAPPLSSSALRPTSLYPWYRFSRAASLAGGIVSLTAIPAFPENQLRAICDILGATDTGLTNAEIDRLLRQCKIDDPHPHENGKIVTIVAKRNRLFDTLARCQERDRCGNNVVAFISTSMAPVRYVGEQARFHSLRERLNLALSFAGFEIGEDGTIRIVAQARTLSESEERASRLRLELQRRGVHLDVLRFCRAEFLEENYFHAVLEATKSVADKIREKSALDTDGVRLADEAFSLDKGRLPRLAFNSLRTPSERSEHMGLWNLVRGMFGIFRNVAAHAPKIRWSINEQDALDLLTLASLIHRRLDIAVPTFRGEPRTNSSPRRE
jgi:uncharacterized protein (TIGR02391 family)